MRSENEDRQASGEAGVEGSGAASGDTAQEAPRQAEEGEDASQAGEASAELESLQDRYLRLAAEYDNFRKRTERERGESWVRAQAQLVERLLDPLDDLQRVADYTVENTTVEALLEGVQLVERKLLRVLEGTGLEMIEAEGVDFDPERHEALMAVPTDRRDEDDTVAQVLQKGYRFKGLLLRPARVQVNKYES